MSMFVCLIVCVFARLVVFVSVFLLVCVFLSYCLPTCLILRVVGLLVHVFVCFFDTSCDMKLHAKQEMHAPRILACFENQYILLYGARHARDS